MHHIHSLSKEAWKRNELKGSAAYARKGTNRMVEEVRDAALDHRKWLHAGLHDLFAAMAQAAPHSTHCQELTQLSDSLSNAQLLERLVNKFYLSWGKGEPACTCTADTLVINGKPDANAGIAH